MGKYYTILRIWKQNIVCPSTNRYISKFQVISNKQNIKRNCMNAVCLKVYMQHAQQLFWEHELSVNKRGNFQEQNENKTRYLRF